MPKFSVKKPLTVFVAVLAILVLGVVAYLKMTPDLMPNMDFPYVILVTTDPGASPETVEADITKPLEQSMATLDRIKNVTSSSMDSVSMVVLEFEDGVNMDTASVDIQQKINQLKGSWSDTVGDPYVLKMNPSMLPVQVTALSYDGKDITELSDFVTDTLSPKLEGITGVASVTVSGTVQHQLHVILSQKKLDDLSRRLSDAIAKQLDDAAGQLSSARGQVNSAKAAIRSAEESAVRDAVTQALTTIQDSLKTMRDSRDQLQANLRELADIQREKARLEAENAPYQARIEAIRHDPSMTEEEKQAAIAEIESDPEYVRIQAELAALDLRMAALGVKWDEAVQRAKEWQKQLEELEKQLRDLETDEGVAKLADQVTAGTLTMADAVTQIISANIQLDSALNQIDQGLQTLEESRSAALSQADLSSSLNLSTITALLTAQNFSMPAGYLKEDGVNYMVSVGDAIGTRQDLEDLVLFDLGMDGIDHPHEGRGRRGHHRQLLGDLRQAQRQGRRHRLLQQAVHLRHGGGVRQHQQPLPGAGGGVQGSFLRAPDGPGGLHIPYHQLHSVLSGLGRAVLGADPVPVPAGPASHRHHPVLHPHQRDLRRGAHVLLRRHHQYDLPVRPGRGGGHAGG